MPTATWDRLAAARRAAVIEAAEAEIAAHGFGNASLNTIARNAGVAKGSLFQYFADKADLCAYVADRASERIRVRMQALMDELSWDADLLTPMMQLVGEWVRYFYSHPTDLALTAATNLESDPTARAAVRERANHHYLAILRPLMTMARDSGKLKPDTDVEALMVAIGVLLPHLALSPHVGGLDPVLGLEGADADTAVQQARRVIASIMTPYVQ